MSFRDLVVRAVPLQKKPDPPRRAKARSGTAAPKADAGGWGTPEERYRRLCLLAQLCRYGYYVKHTSIIPDDLYDRLERVIRRIEKDCRDAIVVIDPRSPSVMPGSDKEGTYPRSVVSLWHEDPRAFVYQQAVIEKAIAFAVEAFKVEAI